MTADAAHVAAVDLLHQGLIDHRLGSATEPPWYLRKPRATRMPKDYVQTYRCKCGQWQGAHADHQRHVAETLAPLVRAARVALSDPHATRGAYVGDDPVPAARIAEGTP